MSGMEYKNPTPVVVGLVPVLYKHLLGFLTIKRGIPPGLGLIALPGGYLEIERWQDGLSREMREETSVDIDPDTWMPMGFASSTLLNRVLLFAKTTPIQFDGIPDFVQNREVQDLGLMFDYMPQQADQIAFPLHADYLELALYQRPISYRRLNNPTGFSSITELRQ